MLPNKAIFLPNQMGKSSDPGLDFHPIWICHFSLRTRLDYQVTDSDGCGGPVTVPPRHLFKGSRMRRARNTAWWAHSSFQRDTHFKGHSSKSTSFPALQPQESLITLWDSLAEAKGHFRLENTLLEAAGPRGPGDDRALGRPGGGLTGTAQETDWGALLLGGGALGAQGWPQGRAGRAQVQQTKASGVNRAKAAKEVLTTAPRVFLGVAPFHLLAPVAFQADDCRLPPGGSPFRCCCSPAQQRAFWSLRPVQTLRQWGTTPPGTAGRPWLCPLHPRGQQNMAEAGALSSAQTPEQPRTTRLGWHHCARHAWA